MRKILSLDGGGCRGVLPATILSRIECKTGKKSAQLFDMIAGTSTGALIACCLKKGMAASDVIEIYRSESKTIFDKSFWSSLKAGFGLIGSRYPADGIESVLEKHLEGVLIGTDLPFLLVASLDFQSGVPRFFKTNDDKNVKLSYAARASSAAPTYFPPKDGLVDGGVYINDPSMAALAEGYKLWNEEPMKMLSLGTGFSLVKETIKGGGLWDWATKILDVVMNGQMGFAAYQTGFTMGHENFLRIQAPLPDDINSSLDNTNPNNIEKLIDFGHTIFDQNQEAIMNLLS